MLAVVELEDLAREVRLERGVVVGQFGQFVLRHGFLLRLRRRRDGELHPVEATLLAFPDSRARNPRSHDPDLSTPPPRGPRRRVRVRARSFAAGRGDERRPRSRAPEARRRAAGRQRDRGRVLRVRPQARRRSASTSPTSRTRSRRPRHAPPSCAAYARDSARCSPTPTRAIRSQTLIDADGAVDAIRQPAAARPGQRDRQRRRRRSWRRSTRSSRTSRPISSGRGARATADRRPARRQARDPQGQAGRGRAGRRRPPGPARRRDRGRGVRRRRRARRGSRPSAPRSPTQQAHQHRRPRADHRQPGRRTVLVPGAGRRVQQRLRRSDGHCRHRHVRADRARRRWR